MQCDVCLASYGVGGRVGDGFAFVGVEGIGGGIEADCLTSLSVVGFGFDVGSNGSLLVVESVGEGEV